MSRPPANVFAPASFSVPVVFFTTSPPGPDTPPVRASACAPSATVAFPASASGASTACVPCTTVTDGSPPANVSVPAPASV